MISSSKLVSVDFAVATSVIPPGDYSKVLLMSVDAATRYKEYSTLAAVELDFADTTNEYKAAELYFNNGGQVLVIGQIGGAETLLEAVQAVELLFTDFIFCVILDDFIASDSRNSEAIALVTAFDARVAPNKRIACFTVTDAAAKTSAETDLMSLIIAAGLNSAAAKYSSTANDVDAILIGAYFSQINLNGVETVKDYAFTSESGPTAEDLTDAEYDELIGKNYNFVATIGNNTLNYGGNVSGGYGLDTLFATIALENDVNAAALAALVEKEYLTQQGSNNILTAVINSIERYITNGFIEPGATYLGATQQITYNSLQFTTIRKGQTLTLGYLLFAVPVANISAADLVARKLPPITIYVNARGSIRQITITGEVRE